MLKNWRAKEEDVDAIAAARQEDPFAVLGPHLTDNGWVIRAFVTDALSVRAVTREGALIAELGRRKGDFFEALIPAADGTPDLPSRSHARRRRRIRTRTHTLLARRWGRSTIICWSRARTSSSIGASARSSGRHEGVDGVVFAVWAPNASRVSVVGDFNQWDGRQLPDAQAHRQRPLGDLRPRFGRRRGLQVRDRFRRRRGAAAQGRPLRLRGGDAAFDRLDRRAHDGFRLDRRRLSRRAASRAKRGAGRFRSSRSISDHGGAATTIAS